MNNQDEILKKKKRKKRAVISSVIIAVLWIFLIAFLLTDMWVATEFIEIEVTGPSMENTLQSGNHIYARKSAKAKYGDIVIIDVSAYQIRDGYGKDTKLIIKRLIATEGDTVRLEDGSVCIRYAGSEDFTVLDEPYIKDETRNVREVTVGEGEIYFLGDHRSISKDSRTVGCYLYTDIVGVVQDWSVRKEGSKSRWEIFWCMVGGAMGFI